MGKKGYYKIGSHTTLNLIGGQNLASFLPCVILSHFVVMYNPQYQGNPALYSREYPQAQNTLPNGMSNSEKKAAQYVDYRVPAGQMPAPVAYGVMPESINDYRATQYYGPSYPYGAPYDNRLLYMQPGQGYNMLSTQENQAKNRRPGSNPYLDSKQVNGSELNPNQMQYMQYYSNAQPNFGGYPPMASGPQYQVNPMIAMMQQGTMMGYPPQAQSVKREPLSSNLYSLNDKGAKKVALQTQQPRLAYAPPTTPYNVSNVSNLAPMANPMVAAQGRPFLGDYPAMQLPPKSIPQPTQAIPPMPSVKQESNTPASAPYSSSLTQSLMQTTHPGNQGRKCIVRQLMS